MSKSYQSILVIKHGALGDIIQALDSFASLRLAYPKAHIALLTTPAFASFFTNCPWFDDIHLDIRASFWRLDAYFGLRKLFHGKWDAVIDLQCSKRTRNYHRYIFKHQTGDWYGNATGCSFPTPDFTGVNNRERMLETVGMAGAAREDASLDWITEKSTFDIPEADYCILVPGCSAAKPSKRWPAERFISLANLALESDILPLLIGTSVDEKAINDVHKAVPDAMNLIGKTNIADLLALSAKSRFIIGNDTGPVFIAARSGGATIMVMGPDTDPLMSAPFGKRAGYVKDSPISAVTADIVFQAALNL